MKLTFIFLRPIIKKNLSPKLQCLHTSQSYETAISNEILNIIDTVSPMEPALETLAPFLSSDIVASVLQADPKPQSGFRFFIWAMRRSQFRSLVSHKSVIDLLLKEKSSFELCWKTLQDVRNSMFSVHPSAFAVLIEAYAKMGLAEKSVESFSKMKDFDCDPDVYCYNAILFVTLQKEVFLLALAVYNQMLKSNSAPNRVTYGILIDAHCKSNRADDALKMFDEMIKRDIMPDKMIYTIIISGLCLANRIDDAIKLLNTMKLVGCSPDLITYNALLNGFSKLGRVDEAFVHLRTFEEDGYVLGVNGYSCLIEGLFRNRRYEEAKALYRKMVEEDINPDVVLYTIMIKGLSEAGQVKSALNLLREMAEKGVAPDTRCYNAVIKAFCDIGLLDKARSLQLEVSKHDCFPTAYTYTILVCGLCRKGLVGEAQHIFNAMEKLGCFPSVVTFNALIDGLCKAGDLEEAHLLFYKMEIGRNPSLFLRLSQGSNRVLDSASLQIMVEQLCESGLILKAYKLLRQLADSGVLPDITTYNILINGFCKANNMSGAFKLLEELQLKGFSPDYVTYGTLIEGLQGVNREEDAFKVFNKMLKNGCKPSWPVYRSLMTWSCRRRKVPLAFSLWLKYLRDLPGWEEKSVKAVEEHFKKGEVEKAVRGLLEMDFKLKKFDLAPYSICLIGFCQARRVDEAFNIFSVLKEFKINVTPPSCVMMINSLCIEGNLDSAIDVFIYTLENGLMLMPRITNKLLLTLLRSQDKTKLAFNLLSRMESVGYNLDAYLYPLTKSLVRLHWDAEKENYAA